MSHSMGGEAARRAGNRSAQLHTHGTQVHAAQKRAAPQFLLSIRFAAESIRTMTTAINSDNVFSKDYDPT